MAAGRLPDDGLARAALLGAGRGAAATVAMSVPLLLASPSDEMGAQPPKRITLEAARAAGVEPGTEAGRNLASTLAHLAFGAGVGAAFSVLRRRFRPPVPSVVQGLAYGLAVWAVSYKGWVPALGIMPPSQHDLPVRRRTNLVAHLVYGGVLGALEPDRRPGVSVGRAAPRGGPARAPDGGRAGSPLGRGRRRPRRSAPCRR